MSENNRMGERLINEFAENYMEKLFYFCLKKTGCNGEAEELVQDIAYQVILALHNGMIPTSFSAWVWQIARNRYARWAKSKHVDRDRFTGDPIDEMELADEGDNALDELIHKEQLSLLRRELAFIKREYRDIVVAYYIDNRSIRDIAATLSLSVSTVQQRLHRARIILKEGMNMAREFGIRSYKPEEVHFSNSCSSFGDFGQPWTILNHGMYKNIFLEAYGNPSTAEELSLELGIALPYMEEELEYLTGQTFLIKNGNKYETAFPIIGKEAQEKIWSYNCRIIAQLTTLLEKLIDEYNAACKAKGINYYGKSIAYEDAKWTLLMKAFDAFAYETVKTKHEYTKRPNNGNWDIVGYQVADILKTSIVGQHGSDTGFMQYKYSYKNIMSKTPEYLDRDEAHAMQAVAEGRWEGCAQGLLDKLIEYGYVAKTESGYEPVIVVFEADAESIIESFTDEEKKELKSIADEIRRIIKDASEFATMVTANDLPAEFRNNERMCHFACANSRLDRACVFDQAIHDGWLKFNEGSAKMLGAYIYV